VTEKKKPAAKQDGNPPKDKPKADQPESVRAISSLAPHPQNPNRMSDEDKALLARTMAEYGDLGCICLNKRTGLLVGGHQRTEVLTAMLKKAGAEAVHVEREFDPPSPTGTIAEGYVEYRGERWRYREVDWTPAKAIAAMLAANKMGRRGENDFTILADDLQELDTGSFDMTLTGFTEKERRQIAEWAANPDGGSGNRSGERKPVTCPECGAEFTP